MSGVYAYCVLHRGKRPPEGLTGILELPVAAHDVDDLTVWISEAEAAPAADLEAVRRHNAVVSAALGEAVMPLRFGGWQADRDELTSRIRERAPQLRAGLRLVEGRVELGIRIVSTRAEPEEAADAVAAGEPTPGRAYLRALSRRRTTRAERRRAQDGVAQRLRAHLGDMAVEQRVRYLSSPELISVAHLVEPSDEPRYRERAASFALESRGELVVHVTGPWPPYSFAS